MNILVSACLLGVECRYDGTGTLNPMLEKALNNKAFTLISVCPEVLGGLPVPRVPCEIRGNRVFGKDGKDYTEPFQKGAEETLALARAHHCHHAILKDRSPSCGFGEIYDGTFTGKLIDGNGVTAALLNRYGIQVVGESRLEDFFNSSGLRFCHSEQREES